MDWFGLADRLILLVHPVDQRLLESRRRGDSRQTSQRADGGRQRADECLAGPTLAQVGLERRAFLWFQFVVDVIRGEGGHVLAVKFSMSE